MSATVIILSRGPACCRSRVYNSCKQEGALPRIRRIRPLRSAARMDVQPSAPPVVAVIVTCEPGAWFDETLASLANQDYPDLSVFVIDSASADDPTPRVAEVLPGAYVRLLPERVGYGTAINGILDSVEGASHYLLCHDD